MGATKHPIAMAEGVTQWHVLSPSPEKKEKGNSFRKLVLRVAKDIVWDRRDKFENILRAITEDSIENLAATMASLWGVERRVVEKKAGEAIAKHLSIILNQPEEILENAEWALFSKPLPIDGGVESYDDFLSDLEPIEVVGGLVERGKESDVKTLIYNLLAAVRFVIYYYLAQSIVRIKRELTNLHNLLWSLLLYEEEEITPEKAMDFVFPSWGKEGRREHYRYFDDAVVVRGEIDKFIIPNQRKEKAFSVGGKKMFTLPAILSAKEIGWYSPTVAALSTTQQVYNCVFVPLWSLDKVSDEENEVENIAKALIAYVKGKSSPLAENFLSGNWKGLNLYNLLFPEQLWLVLVKVAAIGSDIESARKRGALLPDAAAFPIISGGNFVEGSYLGSVYNRWVGLVNLLSAFSGHIDVVLQAVMRKFIPHGEITIALEYKGKQEWKTLYIPSLPRGGGGVVDILLELRKITGGARETKIRNVLVELMDSIKRGYDEIPQETGKSLRFLSELEGSIVVKGEMREEDIILNYQGTTTIDVTLGSQGEPSTAKIKMTVSLTSAKTGEEEILEKLPISIVLTERLRKLCEIRGGLEEQSWNEELGKPVVAYWSSIQANLEELVRKVFHQEKVVFVKPVGIIKVVLNPSAADNLYTNFLPQFVAAFSGYLEDIKGKGWGLFLSPEIPGGAQVKRDGETHLVVPLKWIYIPPDRTGDGGTEEKINISSALILKRIILDLEKVEMGGKNLILSVRFDAGYEIDAPQVGKKEGELESYTDTLTYYTDEIRAKYQRNDFWRYSLSVFFLNMEGIIRQLLQKEGGV